METLSEIRNNLKETTRENQIDDLIDEYINLTIQEINSPSWAFGNKYHHNWSFNKRKHTFSTVASTESYQLPRDLDKIHLVRQTSSPQKIKYVPDEVFYSYIPNPTASGNPLFYRLWDEEGLEVRLAADDTIDIVSSSTSDISQTVSIVGYDTNGIKQSEELTINGTTTVNGTITYDAGRPIRVSKSADTIGNITVTENSGGTTLVIIGRQERSPRFKIIGLYPIPGSAITIYLEYYTRLRRLIYDTDVPDIDSKWIWVIRTGALAKIYQYQEPDAQRTLVTNQLYKEGVTAMVKADIMNPDHIPVFRRHRFDRFTGIVEVGDEEFGAIF